MVNFWNDVWMSQLGPLKLHFNGNGYLDESICVCDVVNEEGNWNSTWLLMILPRSMVNRIRACNSSLRELGADRLSWKWMATRKFSMHESYKHLCSIVSPTQLGDHKVIWKLNAPQ